MEPTKTAIKSLVLDLRKSLEADIEVGLRRYGITPTALRPLDTLKHLDDRGKTARIRMEEAIHHEMERATDSENALAEAVHWFVREVAFTHLNRLVGLKAMEVRGLIPEVIQTRAEYGNRSHVLRDYRDAHPEATSLPDDGLEEAIKEACRQVYPEFRLLFDVGDPSDMRDAPINSLLWPSTPTLKACISSINELDAKIGRFGPPAYGKATPEQSMWAEDEIIGWVYQFYNAEEKVAIRDRGKPKHPAEVAVINQFFTPRWIIKFLVDNTLGRLWLEMHPDSSRVRTKCDYLVPEPAAAGSDGLDSDSPINNPDAAPRRQAKRPQDIRLIDPACGTMHFGHYAFEILQEIYAEAREHRWVKGVDALNDADVPAAILENNLFGVDIDLRAVQLAALSLFMKAKSANPDAHVGQVNLIVADAHLPQGKVRTDFLAQYASEPVIQKAFQEVFESLDNLAEVGSLLRVEERFRQALVSNEFHGKAPGKKKKETRAQQAAFAEIAPGWSPEYTVEQMIGHLREFARWALREHDINAQLFAAETEKSVAFLDLFLHEYDVVVMNPPFGSALESVKPLLSKSYHAYCNNLLCAFVERAIVDLAPHGFMGAVLDRTFLLKMSFEEFRREILLKRGRILTFTDLGWNVLDDADVEVSTLVIDADRKPSNAVFLRINQSQADEMQSNPLKQITQYIVNVEDFLPYPNAAFAYWIPNSVREMFKRYPSFDPEFGLSKEGIHPNAADRLMRQRWEVSSSKVGGDKGWAPVANGGGYSAFYRENDLVINYEDNAKLIRSLRGMRSEDLQFREAITWGKRTDWVSFQYLPKDYAFTHEGLCMFPKDPELIWWFLSVVNSTLMRYTANALCGQHKLSGYIGQLPVAIPDENTKNKLAKIALQMFSLKKEWDSGNEVSGTFSQPWIFKWADANLGLETAVDNCLEYETQINTQLQSLQPEIDKTVYDLYQISLDDQNKINSEVKRIKFFDVVWGYAEKFTKHQKTTEHVARLMSFCLLQAIQNDPDGILPLTEASGHATVLRHIQSGLEEHFGERAAYQVEIDSADYLGRPLGEWLVKNFWKDFHVKWYRNRPILWQIQSQNGSFACLVHIHKMDRDTLPKIRSQYFWLTRNACQAALESARLREESGDRSAAKEVAKLEAMLDDLNDFEKRLTSVIEARVKCIIPDWAQGPYRNGVYDPVLDDGVAVNILPLQEAGLLAKVKVV